jgi:hypothetical protein
MPFGGIESNSADSPQNREGSRKSCKVSLNLTGKNLNQDHAKVSFEMSEANADDQLPQCSTVGSGSLVQFEKLEASTKYHRFESNLFGSHALLNA